MPTPPSCRPPGSAPYSGVVELFCTAHRGATGRPLVLRLSEPGPPGEVAEWSKANDSKSFEGQPSVGSNPTLSVFKGSEEIRGHPKSKAAGDRLITLPEAVRNLWAIGLGAAAEIKQYCLVRDWHSLLSDVDSMGSLPVCLSW